MTGEKYITVKALKEMLSQCKDDSAHVYILGPWAGGARVGGKLSAVCIEETKRAWGLTADKGLREGLGNSNVTLIYQNIAEYQTP